MILPKLRYPIRLWIFLGHIKFQIYILTLATRTESCEWRYKTIRSWTKTVMNRSGAPSQLLALMLYLYVLPTQPYSLCSPRWQNTPFCFNWYNTDISIIKLHTFYQPVLYAIHDQHYLSESEERAGYWVGFGEHCGDAMTHKFLDHETQIIICRSAVRPQKSSTPNHRLAPHGGEVTTSSDPSEDKFPLDHY